MDLQSSLRIASAGMKVQSARMRVTSENLANAQSTAQEPGGDAYHRKTIEFNQQLNRELGIETVAIKRYGQDKSDQPMRFEPDHPAADGDGFVKYPNVTPLLELMDMREAQRSYEANLTAMRQARGMLQQMLDQLRS